MNQKIPVAVLAATGSVGQRFVQLLDAHPLFTVSTLTASDRSVGKTYAEACHWILPGEMPAWARNLVIQPTLPDAANLPAIAFSALPADAAMDVEPLFAQAGCIVCSNASAYRMAADVPILLPEVNPEHVFLLNHQRAVRGWRGGITTNPNCTSTGLTVALKALQDAFGLTRVFAVSMQALSGAGYPGVSSLDIIDNVIPVIKGEEEKVETEPLKMLGRLNNTAIEPADFVISAHTNRVAVVDGHMLCCSVELQHKASPEEAIAAFQQYHAPAISADLHSAPHPAILVRTEDDRPQPKLDRNSGNGMTTVIGRVRRDPLFDLKFVVLSHNTIRGAAGGSIYNAELVVKAGLL